MEEIEKVKELLSQITTPQSEDGTLTDEQKRQLASLVTSEEFLTLLRAMGIGITINHYHTHYHWSGNMGELRQHYSTDVRWNDYRTTVVPYPFNTMVK
jgi:hypothetical protein